MENIRKDRGDREGMEDIKVTWLGTAALKLERKGKILLIDPFVEMEGAENPNTREDFFLGDAILITHGHLDHLSLVPVLEKIRRIPVYCTKAPCRTLQKHGVDASVIHRIGPGDRFAVCGFTVQVYGGKHIHFDRKLVREKLFSGRVFHYRRNLRRIIKLHMQYPEKKETVLYELMSKTTRIQVMGSLGLLESETYRTGADLLCLPYQGSSDLEEHAGMVLKKLKPKAVLLTHFDDAYPPVSGRVDTAGLEEMVLRKFPDTELIVPKCGQYICLHGTETGK